MGNGTNIQPGGLYELESQFRLLDTITLKVSRPFKELLRRVASERKVSMNDVIRQALDAHLESTYPGYLRLYRRLLEEEAQKGKP